ncbi:DUF5789 family protein [Halobaculum gomorrense]|uniref:Uncharacterized protein n=1 Tax=Halobaculum gomorrense TaxID=43928 RepID=A0A1M5QKZ6_9EURY|nr:hypothetical protein [Halobaculum gomorrense]SHH14616.1 hypothetical protein SAMN05443636_1947 [Halobaculum gomorrense]
MADDKRGRDKQAHDSEDRRRERDLATELDHGDESEPPVESESLDDIEADLGSVSFPATGATVVATVGDRTLHAADRTDTVKELIPRTDAETFESPAAVRVRVHRPTVAAAMKRIAEAAAALPDAEVEGSQRDGYERTLRELAAIDAVDEDEGIRVIADWVVEQIREDRKLPGSRAVRREAATYCRANGYEVRNDEWLGV